MDHTLTLRPAFTPVTIILMIIGFMLWVVYGISIDDMVLAVPNAIATIFGVTTIVIALRLRDRPGVTESDA